ncbi:hypothetical protein EYF80_048460 [Liparis tanakae]|uniref:Uncharacterized protein n=1 Tax=Liparis tanakae TaxID=230148 RepID=A0A4Z2FK74_9TELE|nr:hypothetical protein EYF80_048460 [Liparis tanakae]
MRLSTQLVSRRLSATLSPLHDLILEQRLVLLQREEGQLQEVDGPSLCSDAQQVARPQQEEDGHPSGTEKRRRRTTPSLVTPPSSLAASSHRWMVLSSSSDSRRPCGGAERTKWICVTAVVSPCSPVNSTPGHP